jgi:hypothetical protein
LTSLFLAVVKGWIDFGWLWLLTILVLIYGRVSLSREEIRKSLGRTLSASALLAFPAAWALMSYSAWFNPRIQQPSPVALGGYLAVWLFPLYSSLVACVTFNVAARTARKRGAPPRGAILRILAAFVLAAVIVGASVTMGLFCMGATGRGIFD